LSKFDTEIQKGCKKNGVIGVPLMPILIFGAMISLLV